MQLQWFHEDRRFAVAYSDGMVYLSTRQQFDQLIAVEAHQVKTL